MKNKYLLVLAAFVALFSGCKALKKIAAKDVSVHTSANKKQHKPTNDFLNIEVSPGSVVTSKHKTSGIKKNGNDNQYDQLLINSDASIEKMSFLQLKYAIFMNATVEALNNLSLLNKIEEWWGTNYCMGGTTKTCIDCSAFSSLLLKEVFKISLPRTAQEQYAICDKIETADLKQGDLVFFHTQGRAVSHVGVYLINNKFVHASTSNGVTITDLNDAYWLPKFIGAGRINKENNWGANGQ